MLEHDEGDKLNSDMLFSIVEYILIESADSKGAAEWFENTKH